MVLIQEAAALLYLGSTSQTCRGDGWAVSPLFMDHRPSPISYMPQKPRSLKNSYYLTALCLSISDSLPFSFSSLTNGILSPRSLFQMYSNRGRTLLKCLLNISPLVGKCGKINITLIVIILTVDNEMCL